MSRHNNCDYSYSTQQDEHMFLRMAALGFNVSPFDVIQVGDIFCTITNGDILLLEAKVLDTRQALVIADDGNRYNLDRCYRVKD